MTAPTVGTTTNVIQTSSSTIQGIFNHVVDIGANYLVVPIGMRSTGTIVSVVWEAAGGDQALSLLGTGLNEGSARTEFWGLENPDVETADLLITLSTGSMFCLATAITLSDFVSVGSQDDQNSDPATTTTHSLTTTADDLVIQCCKTYNNDGNTDAFVDGAGQTQLLGAQGPADENLLGRCYIGFEANEDAMTVSWDTSTEFTSIAMIFTGAAAAATVDDVNTDEIIDDAETSITLTTSGFGSNISTVKLISGTAETTVLNLAGTGDNYTFDNIDIAALASDTAGAPLTSANNVVQVEADDGTDTAVLTVASNPKSGWSVVEIASAVKTTGSIFENFVGTINDESQIYFPTADTTSVDATGIVTTDSTVDITMQFWDESDDTWKQLTLLIAAAAAGGGGDGIVKSIVQAIVQPIVSSVAKS